MVDVQAGFFKPLGIRGASVVYQTFSGVVTVDGEFASRTVLAYNIKDSEKVYSTVSSGVDGTYSITISLAKNFEEVRIICVGETGENSKIYEHLSHE